MKYRPSRWVIKEPEPEIVEKLLKEFNISKIIARCIVNRGIKNIHQAKIFLKPELKDLYNPFLLNDMEKAVERTREAIEKKEKILIYGDRDVDGISSVAIVKRVIDSLGANSVWYIPSDEGYGLNNDVIKRYSLEDVKLIITVDCGISSYNEVELAKTLGIDVIVTDHHEPPDEIPKAVAVINPKRKDSIYPFKELAGCGVAFKFAQALFQSQSEYYNQTMIFVDLETTGISASLNEIVEIAAYKAKNFVVLDKFHSLVKPTGEIPQEVIEIHGITNEMCENAPPIEDVMEKFLSFSGEATIVAHNAEFDLGFLRNSAKKINRKINNPVIDTLLLSRKHFNFRSNALGSLVHNLNIEVGGLHRAENDAFCVMNVLQSLLEKIEVKRKIFIEEYLDLVTLGTIADVVPLVSENRIFVKYGIESIEKTQILGLKMLLEKLNLLKDKLTSKRISWILTPFLNAAGRLNRADLSCELLITNDENVAVELIGEIEKLNNERKLLQDKNLDRVLGLIEKQVIPSDKVIVLVVESLEHGVTGIVASNIVKKFNKPVVILVVNEDVVLGVARAVKGFNILEVVSKCRELLVKFGGHSAACGFTIEKKNINKFVEKFKDIINEIITDDVLVSKIEMDGIVDVSEVDRKLIEEIDLLEPFGQGNFYPTFMMENVHIKSISRMGADGGHLKLYLRKDGFEISAVGWSIGELYDELEKLYSANLVFSPEINRWQNNDEVRISLLDIKPYDDQNNWRKYEDV